MVYTDMNRGIYGTQKHTQLHNCNKFCSPVFVRADPYFSLFPVLPKFEVKVNVPQTITISDEEFQVDACAK